MTLPKKVALAVTDFNGPFYENGEKSGAFYSEVYHPYLVFQKAGFSIDLVSESGKIGWDEHSIEPAFASAEELAHSKDPNDPFAKLLAAIKPASQARASDYGIFFAAGGHGTVYDFVGKAPGLFKLASDIWAQGGVVSAVCHGPCLLPWVKDPKTGESVLKGRKATGFPDSGEVVLKLTELLDRKQLAYTERLIKDAGATYVEPKQPFDVEVVTEGKLVTGANPASATPTAEAAIKAFGS